MDEAFLGQMAMLVAAQNKLLRRVAFAVRGLAAWIYGLMVVGVVLGYREWNSLLLTSVTGPARAAFMATLDEEAIIKGVVAIDAALCVTVLLFTRQRVLLLAHLFLSGFVVYWFSSSWEGGSVLKPGFSIVLACMLPCSLLAIDKLHGTVQDMEKGLTRLLLVGRELDDTKID